MSGTATAKLAEDQAKAVLAAVQSSMSLVLTSAARVNPGQTISAALIPTAPQIDASELANGIINVAFTAKNVLFKTADPISIPTYGDLRGDADAPNTAAGSVLGGVPFPAPLGTVSTPPNPTNTNVPGDLGQVFGIVAVPKLKVKVDIHWRLTKQIDPHDPSKGAQTLDEGHDFVATNGVSSPTLSVVIPPTFSELRFDTLTSPQPDRVCLFADITLTLDFSDPKDKGPATSTFSLGPVEILLLPVLIPTVVAIFSEPNFGVTNTGTVLVIVPEHSPISSVRALIDQLRRVESALDGVRSIASVAAWLLGIDELVNAIPDQPRVRFKAANLIRKFSDIEVKPGVIFNIGSTNFDDQAQSLMVFGLPGTKVWFYNDTYLRIPPATNQGHYAIDLVATPFVAIRDLEDGDASSEPPHTMPPNSSTLPIIFSWAPDKSDSDKDWEQSMSSFKFDDEWLAIVEDAPATDDPPVGSCGSLQPPPDPTSRTRPKPLRGRNRKRV